MRKKRNQWRTRKIWTQHHGEIPFDEFRLSNEIHHIDGDPSNDDIMNLVCLTVHEHYEIHFWQEDWHACTLIMTKLKMGADAIAEMRVLSALKNSGVNNPAYDHTLYTFVNKKSREKVVMTQNDFSKSYGFSRSKICRLISGKKWQVGDWSLAQHVDRVDQRAPFEPDVIYRWRHRMSEEIIEATRSEMAASFGLNTNHLRSMIKEKRHSCQNWELDTGFPIVTRPSNQKDLTLYCFQHTVTKETMIATRAEIESKMKIPKSAICRMISGQAKSANGWRLISK